MTKEKKEKKKQKEESFFYKYKNDKRYKAKVQLAGYGVLILLIILLANLSGSASSSNNLNNITSSPSNEEYQEETLIEKINTNYQYDININYTNTKEETLNYHYYGKNYNNTLEINKELNDATSTYYKVDDYYYQKENEEYIFAKTDEIYDLIDSNYIELNKVLEYIEKSSLEHITTSSEGIKEFQYNLYLRDIIINNKTDDIVAINTKEENDTLTITIDYTKLLKTMNNEVKECIITYTYTNIDKIEEFHIIDQSKEEE